MAPIDDLEIVVPVDVVLAQLPSAGDGVATISEAAGKPLREPGCIAPQSPRLRVDIHFVDPEYTSRVEVWQPQRGATAGGGCVGIRAGTIDVGEPDDRD